MKKLISILALAGIAVYLASGQFPINRSVRFALPAPAAGGGGPDTWYTNAVGSVRDGNIQGNGSSETARPVTIGQAGTATKLRIEIEAYTGNTGLKMALYTNPGKVLVTSGSTTVTGNGVVEISVTPAEVSATTYYVAWEAAGNGISFTTDGSTSEQMIYGTETYANFPADPLAAATTFSRDYFFGVYVD